MKEKGSRKVNFPGSYYFIGHCCLYYDLDYLNRSDSYRSRACILRGLMRNLRKILGHTWDEMFKNILHVVHGGPCRQSFCFYSWALSVHPGLVAGRFPI